MYIKVTSNGAVSVEEPDDFRRFKISAEMRNSHIDRLSAALEGLAVVVDAKQAWVGADALRARTPAAQAPHWEADFMAMIDGARKYGYVRDDDGLLAIGAHIEWQEPD